MPQCYSLFSFFCKWLTSLWGTFYYFGEEEELTANAGIPCKITFSQENNMKKSLFCLYSRAQERVEISCCFSTLENLLLFSYY